MEQDQNTREQRLNLRFTSTERQAVKEAAASFGLTSGSYGRAILVNAARLRLRELRIRRKYATTPEAA